MLASVGGTGTLRSLSSERADARCPNAESTVGRSREVVDLAQRLLAGRPVLLEGPAGIGKTHLARAVLHRLSESGYSAIEALGGSSSPDVPLGPFVQLVPALVGEVPLAGLIATTLDGLRRRAGQGPVAVLADDVDLFDEASAVLLGHLVRAGHVRMIATCRNLNTLAPPLASLLAEGHLDLSQVGPLEARDVAALAATLLGEALAPASGTMVHDITGGNPLWVTQLIRAASARDALTPSPAGLQLDATDAIGGLDRLLVLRLGRLGPEERDAIDLLAVAGALPLDLFESLVGPDLPAALAHRGLVTAPQSLGEPTVQLAHPLYRHCALAGLGVLEVRDLLRRLIAAARCQADTSRTSLVRLALWHAELGEHFEPDRLGVAARELHWGLLDLVRRHLAGDRGAGRGDESGWAVGLGSAAARAAAAYRLASAAWEEDRTFANGIALARSLATFRPELSEEMVAVLDALRDLARSDEDRAWLAVCQAIWLFWTLGDREGALSELAVVKRALGAPWDAVVESTAAGLRVQIGEIATAMSMLENIEIDDTAPPAVQLTMHSPLAAGLSLSGRLVDGVERARASVEMALLLGEESTVSMMELLISQYWGMLCLHRYEETAAGARAIADLLAQTEDYEPRALFAGMEARALLFSGRPVTAVDKVANAIRWHGSLSMFGFRPLLHSTRALALVWTGRTEEARAECGEARRWHQPPRPFDAELDLAEAVVLAAEGRRTRHRSLRGSPPGTPRRRGAGTTPSSRHTQRCGSNRRPRPSRRSRPPRQGSTTRPRHCHWRTAGHSSMATRRGWGRSPSTRSTAVSTCSRSRCWRLRSHGCRHTGRAHCGTVCPSASSDNGHGVRALVPPCWWSTRRPPHSRRGSWRSRPSPVGAGRPRPSPTSSRCRSGPSRATSTVPLPSWVSSREKTSARSSARRPFRRGPDGSVAGLTVGGPPRKLALPVRRLDALGSRRCTTR